MKRTCNCEKTNLCRLCYLFHHDPEYRLLWDGDPIEDNDEEIILAAQPYSLLDENRLKNLIKGVKDTIRINGCQLEVGTYKGGSAYCISQANLGKVTYVCDTFEGHPINEENGHKKGDFKYNLEDVKTYLKDCNIDFIHGIFPSSAKIISDKKFSFIHLDCDYINDNILQWCWRRLSENGILIIDDYGIEDCPTIKSTVDKFNLPISNNENYQITIVKKDNLPLVRKKLTEIKLWQPLSPGDVAVTTMVIASIHKQFPNRFRTDFEGTCKEAFFANNPYITSLPKTKRIRVDYSVDYDCNKSISFAQSMCDKLTKVLKLETPLINQCRRPLLYLTNEEKKPILGFSNKMVLGNFGWKNDCTIKGKGNHLIWKEVVDWCNQNDIEVVQVGEASSNHTHPYVEGTTNMIGKTTTRELIRLTNQCVATLSPISLLTHLSAAFDKPNICLSSRESLDFAMYRTTISLNCIGLLDCCSGTKTGGCWRNHLDNYQKDQVGAFILDKGGNKIKTHDSCALPMVQSDGTLIPKCHALIGSSTIIEHLKVIFKAKNLL